VALTRARRGLVVVGHTATLSGERHTWARWLAWAEGEGAFLRDWERILAALGSADPDAAPRDPGRRKKQRARSDRVGKDAAAARQGRALERADQAPQPPPKRRKKRKQFLAAAGGIVQ
jgi:hypothetical protein